MAHLLFHEPTGLELITDSSDEVIALGCYVTNGSRSGEVLDTYFEEEDHKDGRVWYRAYVSVIFSDGGRARWLASSLTVTHC
jgi:hypothetical protein